MLSAGIESVGMILYQHQPAGPTWFVLGIFPLAGFPNLAAKVEEERGEAATELRFALSSALNVVEC